MNNKYFLSARFFNESSQSNFFGSINIKDGFFTGQGPFSYVNSDKFQLKGYRFNKNIVDDSAYIIFPSQEYLDTSDSLLFGFFDKNNLTSTIHFLSKIGKKKNFLGRYSGFQINLDEQVNLLDSLRFLESGLDFTKPDLSLDLDGDKYDVSKGYLLIRY